MYAMKTASTIRLLVELRYRCYRMVWARSHASQARRIWQCPTITERARMEMSSISSMTYNTRLALSEYKTFACEHAESKEKSQCIPRDQNRETWELSTCDMEVVVPALPVDTFPVRNKLPPEHVMRTFYLKSSCRFRAPMNHPR